MTSSSESVGSSFFNGIIAAAQQLGLPSHAIVTALAEKTPLKPLLADPTSRIDFDLFQQFISALEACSDNTSESDCLGIRLGRALGLGSFNALGYAAAHCELVEHALALIPKYESLVLTLGKTDVVLEDDFVYVSWSMRHQQKSELLEELFLSSWLTLGQLSTGKLLANYNIKFHFSRRPPNNKDAWALIFGEHISFDQPIAQVIIHRDLLKLPLLKNDAFMRNIMLKEADSLTSLLSNDLLHQIDQWLQIELPKGGAEFSALASYLNTSERTLRRRLKEAGHRFNDVLIKHRKEKAEYYVCNTQLTFWDVAEKLGYRQLTTFNAAYKRWTGISPAKHRAQIRI